MVAQSAESVDEKAQQRDDGVKPEQCFFVVAEPWVRSVLVAHPPQPDHILVLALLE